MSTEPETTPIPPVDLLVEATERMRKQLRQFEIEQQEDKRKMQAAVELLRKHKAVSVGVEYSGASDSGCLDSVHIYARTFTEDELFDVGYTEVDEATEKVVEQMGEDFLNELGWALVELIVPGGYEINDGGQGTIVLDVASGRILNNHGTNSVEYNTNELTLGEDDNADVQN
jgi:hypothetical protein